MSESELAGLAGLAAAADRVEAGAATPGGAPVAAAPEQISPEQESVAVVELLAGALEAFFPLHYSPETRAEAAKKLKPLLVKYGASGGFFARWGAEIEAGFFFGGLAVASYRQVKAERAAAEKGGDDGGGE